MVHPLRNILNKLRWDAKVNPEDYEITYRHRGTPGDVKRIRASEIRTLGKSYFTLESDSGGEQSTIPFHRILEIHNLADGSTVWVKRTARSGR